MITIAAQSSSAVPLHTPHSSPERARFVRSELPQQARKFQENQYRVTELLIECHDHGYWKSDYKCFSDYVAAEVKLSQRTVQELMRVARICANVGISNEDVVAVGWSKVAAMSKHLTKANAQKLVALAKDTPLRQLKQKLSDSEKGSGANKHSNGKRSTLVLTATIQHAIQLASMQTQVTDIQANLELIASVFEQHYRRSESAPSQN